MYKSIATMLIATAATLGAGAAHAGDVSWQIGINLPAVGALVSNAPYYAAVPMYQPEPVYVPAPPVYIRAPAYRVAPPVAYYPRQDVYYQPVPVAYPRYDGDWYHRERRWEDHGYRGHRGDHHDHHDHGDRRDRDDRDD